MATSAGLVMAITSSVLYKVRGKNIIKIFLKNKRKRIKMYVQYHRDTEKSGID